MNDSVFESIIGSDPPPLVFEPLRPWKVRKMRAVLEEAERTRPKSAEGRAALANLLQACRAALAEYEMCSPLARLRRSPRRFDAVVGHRAQTVEDAIAEADDWPPSRAAVQYALDVLVAEECVETEATVPSRAAPRNALRSVTQPRPKPKGPENLSPMQIAVLGIVLEFGGTPDEIVDRLSAEYDRPPTRRSVIEAHERRMKKTGGAAGRQGSGPRRGSGAPRRRR